MRKNIFLYSFFIVSAINIASLFFNVNPAFTITKPLIVLTLMLYYIVAVPDRSKVFVAALFFCMVGDVLLLFVESNELFFLTGLLAFLAGHILYIIVCRQHQGQIIGEQLLSTQQIRFALPIVLAGTGLIVILFPVLGDLKLPVTIYAIVLMIMVITALLRFGKTSSASFWKVFLGAIFFMLSDSMLAINKFLNPFHEAATYIMITYILAQLLIVTGITEHEALKIKKAE